MTSHPHRDMATVSAVAWHERLEDLRHDLTSTLTYATVSAVAWHARLEDLRHDLTSTLIYGHSVYSSMACTVRGLAT